MGARFSFVFSWHQGQHLSFNLLHLNSDLALEKEFLTSLDHPHIIKLRGVARSGPAGDALVLDRLAETLDQRMKRWRKPAKGRRRTGLSASLTSSFNSSFASMVKSSSRASSIEVLDEDVSFRPRKSLTAVELEPKAADGVLRDRLGIGE